MIRVVLIGNAQSIHISRWANSLQDSGLEVHLISLKVTHPQNYNDKVNVHYLSKKGPHGYLLCKNEISKLILKIKPDIINAHYASGYGMLANSIKYKAPYLLSVWGSDIFEFPRKSFINKLILKRNLKSASSIASTSEIMKKETQLYTNKTIYVTPFGVDIDKFYQYNKTENNYNQENTVIGIVKSMNDIYGVEVLIYAFHKLFKKYPMCKLHLLLVGGGKDLAKYKNLVIDLEISEVVEFTGQIDHAKVPEYLNMIDIFVAPSIVEESFGVSLIEASACKLPVIASDIGGIPEVVKNNHTGLLVPKENVEELSNEIDLVLKDIELRLRLGENGRKFVEENFSWQKSVDNMIEVYSNMIQKNNS